MCAIVATLACSVGCRAPQPTEINPGSDTTSHAFHWTQYVLTDQLSSGLRGVSVVSDTDIWVGGTIITRDSTGKYDDANPYNVGHWNGVRWELIRVPFSIGKHVTSAIDVSAIVPFSSTEVWFTSGAATVLKDGAWRMIADTAFDGDCSQGGWSPGPGQAYFIGNYGFTGGNVVQWNGSHGLRLRPTALFPLRSIYGSYPSNSSTPEILAVGSSASGGHYGKVLVGVDPVNNMCSVLSDSGLGNQNDDIWFESGKAYYIAGGYLYYATRVTDTTVWRSVFPPAFPHYGFGAVKGNAWNDVIAVGDALMHYNGSTWIDFGFGSDHVFGYCAIKGNTAAVVGHFKTGSAFQTTVWIGKR